MGIHRYFEPDGARLALEKYAESYASGAWTVGEKIRLDGAAGVAFDMSLPIGERRGGFHSVYEGLRRYWLVFRGSRVHWSEARVFEALDELALLVGPRSGWTLTGLADCPDHGELLYAVDRMTGIKSTKTSYGSVMAMSKFLHFLNPGLFPIYDGAVVEERVLHTFSADWRAFAPTLRASELRLHMGAIYYLKYVLFAAELMRPHRVELMAIYRDWIERQLASEGVEPDTGADWEAQEARAFEFIAIGAELASK